MITPDEVAATDRAWLVRRWRASAALLLVVAVVAAVGVAVPLVLGVVLTAGAAANAVQAGWHAAAKVGAP